MFQPDELKSSEPLLWSTGTGIEVWRLLRASREGDLPTVQRLIGSNPALIRCHYQYRKPLTFAVQENRLEVTAFLLERDPNPTGLAFGDSLFEVAQDRGFHEMERLLRESLPNISDRGEPVAQAIRDRDLTAVHRLLDRNPDLLHSGDLRSNQPIHWAVMTRQLDLIDELLRRGADLEAARQDGAKPIHLINGDYHFRGWTKDFPTPAAEVLDHLRHRGAYCDICTAAHSGDLARVRELLAEDRSLANHRSGYQGYYLGSGSPLRNAAATGQLEIVKLLLEFGADPNLPDEGMAPRGRALYDAVSGGHFEIAQLLLERGAFPSQMVESSADALSRALMRDDRRMVELLCRYGSARSIEILGYYGDLETGAAVFAANPSLADDPGAFIAAAEEGNQSFLDLMLRHRPNLIHRLSCAGQTPAITEYLFDRGMAPSRPNWLGITPLHQLARAGRLDQATLFIARGANLLAREDELHSTPLGWAAKAGQVAMTRLLLESGAQPQLPDDPPWATPLAWATRRGHPEVAGALRDALGARA
jgi:ankyrin repeat protein